MPDPFFASSKARKRKRNDPRADGLSGRSQKSLSKKSAEAAHPQTGPRPKKQKRHLDEELSDQTDDEGGIDDLDLRGNDDADIGASGDEDENETPAEKRLRLAKLYLEGLKSDLGGGEYDAGEIDRELIASRLKQDVLEHSGKVHLFIADSFDFTQAPWATLRVRGHRFSVTSAIALESGKYLFTAGKEGSIIKWDLKSGKKLAILPKVRPTNSAQKGKGKGKALPDPGIEGHTDEVLSLAISGDGKLLASAGRDRKVGIWDIETCKWIKGFSGHLAHKDVVSNVVFKKGTNQLYSGSFDRTTKVYDLTPSVMGYVETLFGHQDLILGLDALRGDSCVTVGARDKTARYWKIVEETQLVFRGGGRSRIREVLEGDLRGDDEGDDVDTAGPDAPPRAKAQEIKQFIEGSLECVAMIDESTFLTGGDSGSICLWSNQKKKPIFTQPVAHGFNEVQSSTEGVIQTPRWITALASLRYSDIFASGSWEGNIRIWKLDPKLKSFNLIGVVTASGVINSLQLLTPPASFFNSATWISPRSTDISHPSRQNLKHGLSPVLIVAGLGKEHRFGRWLHIKEDGASNSAMALVFSPRTS